jgi:hypothetical protein
MAVNRHRSTATASDERRDRRRAPDGQLRYKLVARRAAIGVAKRSPEGGRAQAAWRVPGEPADVVGHRRRTPKGRPLLRQVMVDGQLTGEASDLGPPAGTTFVLDGYGGAA